jgi:serine/threonine protein kinase/tetratricopeptide (TPR) repeat protein
MEGRRISHYEVGERLGSGGMGSVYRARDTRLGREVALKFPSELAAKDRSILERFEAEARALSAVDHPNVCTIFDIGETDDGSPFFAMAYCPGHTLAEQLARGALEPAAVVDLGAQIAGGLAVAHEAGVIHRDIKPENVIIDDRGRAKIIDFGIARTSESRLTNQGAAVGTAGYMAPEQLRGDAVDPRTDVWGLGVLLYQMLTGRLPFAAPYEQAISYRVLYEEPEPLEVVLDEHYAALWPLILACLAKDPEARPASMADVHRELTGMLRQTDDRASARWQPSGIAGVMRLHGRRVMAATMLGALILLSLITLLPRESSSLPSEKYVVVLPLNASGEGDDTQLLSEGLTVALTNRLVQLSSYTDDSYWVVPFSEVRARSVTTPSAARRVFGATLVVEGRALATPGGVTLQLSLIDTGSLRTLRALSFELPHDQIHRIETEATWRLAELMEVAFRPESTNALSAGGTDDAAAYDLYLQGKAHLQRYERRENLEAAVGLLQQAVDRDPRFGAAYASLGEGQWRLYEMTRDELYIPLAVRSLERALAIDRHISEAYVTLARLHSSTDRLDEALSAIDRALVLEPSNVDAYLVLGRIHDRADRPEQAETALKQAISMRPSYWAGYNDLGGFYYRRGRYEEAITQFNRVVLLTPDNVRAHSNLGATYFHMDRFEEAAASFEASVTLEPTFPAISNLATLYFFMGEMGGAAEMYRRALEIQDGDYRLWLNLASAYGALDRQPDRASALQEAIRLADRQLQVNPGDPSVRIDLAGALAAVGDTGRAGDLLRSFERGRIGDVEVLYLIGATYEVLGRRGDALDWLCHAFSAGFSGVSLENNPALADLRSDPASARLAECTTSP